MARLVLIAGLLAATALGGPARAADDSEAEALRAQLRATVLQLRQLQDQQATPAAPTPAPAAPSADTTALKTKLAASDAALRQARRGAADAARLQAELTRAQADDARLAADAAAQAGELDKYKAAFTQADAAGRALSAERDHLKVDLAHTGAVATACQVKNAKLIKLSEDLLAAYGKVGFGQVIGAREPFLGIKRVQLENLAQDREDAIRDARCDERIGGGAPPPAGGR